MLLSRVLFYECATNLTKGVRVKDRTSYKPRVQAYMCTYAVLAVKECLHWGILQLSCLDLFCII